MTFFSPPPQSLLVGKLTRWKLNRISFLADWRTYESTLMRKEDILSFTDVQAMYIQCVQASRSLALHKYGEPAFEELYEIFYIVEPSTSTYIVFFKFTLTFHS